MTDERLPPANSSAAPAPSTPLAVRYGIYLAVTLAFTVGWLILLGVFGYHGWSLVVVSLILGLITFLSTRSFLVDRYLKLPPGPEAAPHPTDLLRELVDLLVFVVVLVLLLKSFIAEAFVIPTGSMATTLYGNQKLVPCPKCGYRFPVNSSNEVDNNQLIARCTCPNCLQRIQFSSSNLPLASGYELLNPVGNHTGDRVLVAKFIYDLFQRDPDRLDVVVFKFPGDSRFPESGPYQLGSQINYIKRLVGLPGEAIAIHRGQVYRLSPQWGIHFDDLPENLTTAEKEARRRELWRFAYMHESTVSNPRSITANDETAKTYMGFWNQNRFEIIRKSPETILAMQRIVYDHDFMPRDLGQSPLGAPIRWAGPGWKSVGSGFVSPAAAEQISWLRYSHILRPENPETTPEPELITDFLGYNAGVMGGSAPVRGKNWVSDLILETEVEINKSEGELTLELSKGIDRFQARWNLADGYCKLMRLRSDGTKPPLSSELARSSRPTAVRKPGRYHLRFANVDQRLTVWVDNELPFGDGVEDDKPYLGGPVGANDLQPAGIGVSNTSVTLRSIKLFRDTYYTTNPSGADADISDWRASAEWNGGRGWKETLNGPMPIQFLYVQPDHFLCLGDNSPNSSDSRTWGLVPRRLLLGRALLVFWPVFPENRLKRIH
jgi:signal peptidase I